MNLVVEPPRAPPRLRVLSEPLRRRLRNRSPDDQPQVLPRVFNVRLNFVGVSFDPRHAPGDERAAHNRQDQPFYVPSVQALRAGGPFDDQLYAERGQDLQYCPERWTHVAAERSVKTCSIYIRLLGNGPHSVGARDVADGSGSKSGHHRSRARH
jgi:hypothetical protein